MEASSYNYPETKIPPLPRFLFRTRLRQPLDIIEKNRGMLDI